MLEPQVISALVSLIAYQYFLWIILKPGGYTDVLEFSLSDCSFFQTADKFFEGLRNRRRHFLGNFLCSVRVAGVDKIKQDHGISSFRKLQERRNSEVGGQSWRRGWGEKVLAQVLILLWFEQFYSMAAKRDIYYSVGNKLQVINLYWILRRLYFNPSSYSLIYFFFN